MPPVTLLSQPSTVFIDTIELDCTIKETHTVEVEVTEHPVETGVNISDHARPKPAEVTLEGIITNAPISSQQMGSNTAGTAGSTSAAGVTGQPGRAEAVYLQLLDLHDHPRFVSIITSLFTYTNMLLTSLEVPRDKELGDCVKFTSKFKYVRTVTTASTTVATKTVKGKPKVVQGAKSTLPVSQGSNLFNSQVQAAQAATGGGAPAPAH